ncbi:hypothetical protein F4811DRAFT_549472 [Daldinia bambusicola]|nr:hypothetical protein F4811DRAFT_549472 [Daldinia bambusicola]
MADPFTALGTASNILTFVEFAWKLLTKTYTTYKSATGESEGNRILSLITKDAARLGDAIIAAPDCEGDLRELVEEAKGISHDLREVLENLQVRGTKTAWKSFVVALNELWQSSEVKSLSDRLTKLQNAIILHMQKLLLDKVSGIPHKITELERTSNELGTTIQVEFRQLREDFATSMRKFQRKDSNHPAMDKYLKRWDGTKPLDDASIYKSLVDLQDLLTKATRLHEAGKTTEDSQRVLRSLYFTGIAVRHKNIAEAHARTFAWVFKRKPPEFVDWLKNSPNGIFWIQGKPGSGKSTLMKFLSNHDSTRTNLEPWAEDKELVMARYFFWNAGSPLQKSREGLFRSLLFGIVRNCPRLASRVLALRIESRDEWDDDWSWTVDELLAIIQKIVDECEGTKFCFFIDGMDEYEEDKTDLVNLVETIQAFASFPNLKLCVSSRPWSIFADAFGQDPKLSLKVEDLTRDDIRQYVYGKFEENKHFVLLRNKDPIALELVEEICERAKGVFLWVYLVVRDLLVGFTNGDSARFLKTRLEGFPEDLDSFFRHMINAISPIYFPSTARIFEIARTAPEPQFATAFSFIDDVEDDPEFAIKMAVKTIPSSELQLRHDQVRQRLDARSKGLLEVTDDFDGGSLLAEDLCLRVDFIHRTVRDFLVLTDGLGSFISQYSDNTSTALVMCNALVATLKESPPLGHNKMDIRKMRVLEQLFGWAAQAERDTMAVSTALIPILDSAKQASPELPSHFKSNFSKASLDRSFLGLTCRWGILSYIKAKMDYIRTSTFTNEIHTALLDIALNNYHDRINLALVEILLDNGANPNQTYSHETIWVRFIRRSKEKGIRNNADIERAIELLVNHGANAMLLDRTEPAPEPDKMAGGSLATTQQSALKAFTLKMKELLTGRWAGA